MSLGPWVVAAVLACRAPAIEGDDPDPTVPGSTPATGPTGDTSSTPTADTASEPATFDCSAIPEQPLAVTQLRDPRGYHDLAFDGLGNVLGDDGSVLLQATYDGETSVFLPDPGTVQGMDRLPDGDLVYADQIRGLIRVTPSGAASVVGGGPSMYGVTAAPDGTVFTANGVDVVRYDLQSGEPTRLFHDLTIPAYSLDFAPDFRTLYIGTHRYGGEVYALALDDDLNPIGDPTPFVALDAGQDQLHDGLAVDWCGNVYVLEFFTNNLYRITPEGEASLLVDFTRRTYGHGLEWGSGIGGWRNDALYLPQPYNDRRVVEIVIGVPAREWNGDPLP